MKRAHKALSLIILSLFWGRAGALELFKCVNGLLEATDIADGQIARKGVLRPFRAGEYLVFPSIEKDRVTGAYVYRDEQGWYFDSVEPVGGGELQPLKSHEGDARLVANVNGLATLTLFLLKGKIANEGNGELPLMRFKGPASSAAVMEPLKNEFRQRKAWIRTHNLMEEKFRQFSFLMTHSCNESTQVEDEHLSGK